MRQLLMSYLGVSKESFIARFTAIHASRGMEI
jgi:hypothetical protein